MQNNTLDEILADYRVDPRDIEVSLGVSHECVRLWRRGHRRITPDHAREIEDKFGIPKHLLRPDLWEAPKGFRRRDQAAATTETTA